MSIELPARQLQAEMGRALAGAPFDGPPPGLAAARVVWVDAGDQVLVHLDSVQVKLVNRLLCLSIDLESDQTGRKTLSLGIALGGTDGAASSYGTTGALPFGDAALAVRWGALLGGAVWAALHQVAAAHLAPVERPGAFYAREGLLGIAASPPATAAPAPAKSPGGPPPAKKLP